MPPTVHARVPLSLLEAIRDVDSPGGEVETEYVQELRNKRLGLSDTVYAQIRRYSDAVKRNQAIAITEATGLSTLIGRRADADAIFIAAGRRLAEAVYLTISPTMRRTILLMPGFLARPLALRQLKKLAGRFFNSSIRRMGGFVIFAVRDSVSLDSAPGSTGCLYYESALRELLRLMVRGGGPVEHVRCASRGEGACEWRADWRVTRNAA